MTFDDHLPMLVIAAPLMVATVLAALRRQVPRRVVESISIATAAAVLAGSVRIAMLACRRVPVVWLGGWTPRHGMALGIALSAEPIGAVLAAFAATLILAGLLFSWHYFDDVRGLYHSLMLIFLASMVAFCFSGDAFNLFVIFELMSVVAFALTGYKIEESSLEGAFNFGVTNSVAALLMLTGIALLYARTGALNLAQIGRTLAAGPLDGLVIVSLVLVLSALMIKGGIVPFHFWLSDAHAVAPTPVCVQFSGLMIALWLYGAAHIYWLVYAEAVAPIRETLQCILLVMGAITVILGGVMSLFQRHMKRMLAFSSISHMGILLLGFAGLDARSTAASALYIVGHGLVKGGLFLLTGILLHRFGTVDQVALYGAGKELKFTGAWFFAGGLLLAGLSPFGVWFGEARIDEALGGIGLHWPGWIIVAGSALTGAAVLRAGARVFLGIGTVAESEKREPTEKDKRSKPGPSSPNPLMLVAACGLLVLAVVLGVLTRMESLLDAGAEILSRQGLYAAHVLEGTALAPHITGVSFPAGAERGIIAAAAAVLLAAVLLFTRWRALRAIELLQQALNVVHSGKVTDYVAWIVVGATLIGGSFAVFHGKRQDESGHRLSAEPRGDGRRDVHGRFLAPAAAPRAFDQVADHAPLLTDEVHIVFSALQKLAPHVLEDKRNALLRPADEVEGDQTAGDIRPHHQHAEVHGPDVVPPGAPVQRDHDLTTVVVERDDRRLDEEEQEDVAERPSADLERLAQEPSHRRIFFASTRRFAYTPTARSYIHAGITRAMRVAIDMGRGNSMTRAPRSIPPAICFAARSTGTRNGIRNSFFSVIGVATKPGLTTVTRMANDASSIRAASRKACMAALLAEYPELLGRPRSPASEAIPANRPERRSIIAGITASKRCSIPK